MKWMICWQVAVPLLFQGHVNALDEYLAHSREHQMAFVQLLDEFVHPNKNMDMVVRLTVISLL